MGKLGEIMVMTAISVRGLITEERCSLLISKIIKKMKMTIAAPATVYNYPLKGKGGVGFTHLQPITESFIAFDVWPKLNGAYLIICSCKYFSQESVRKLLEKQGLEIVVIDTNVLGLKHERS